MRSLIIVLTTALVFSVGCRQNPYMEAYIDTVNLEKLALEDRLYELEYDYERLLEQLDKCQCGRASTKPVRTRRSSRTKPDASPIEEIPPQAIIEDTIEGPTIQFEDDSGSPATIDDAPLDPDDDAAPVPPFELDVESLNSSASSIRTSTDSEPAAVSRIRLDQRYTGPDGRGRNNQPEYLRLVIQPTDKQGKYYPTTGKLTVVAFDADTKKRIGRWDLDADDVQELLNRNSVPRGIDVRLPWPEKASQSERLRVFARLTIADGHPLEADHEIQTPLIAQRSDVWTARNAQASATEPIRPRGDSEPRRASRKPKKPTWRPYR